MPRKTFTTIIIIASVVLLAFFGLSFYLSRKSAPAGEPITIRDFVPFGKAIQSSKNPSSGVQTKTASQTGTSAEVLPIPKLRQISSSEIAGGYAIEQERIAESREQAQASDKQQTLAFDRNLKMGDEGADVKELQIFLNQNITNSTAATDKNTQVAKSGAGSFGHETNHFGPATKAAVVLFQEKYANDILKPSGLTQGNGIVDERTRAKIHELESLIPKKEVATAVRYVERSTGNIYETFLDRIGNKKISATVIPKIHESFFGNDGNSVILRYLDDDNETIETFSGILPKEQIGGDSSLELGGVFLPQHIRDITVSPDGTKIFYILSSEGSAAGYISEFGGQKKSQVFSSPFSEWTPKWINNRLIAFNTKPSSGVPGYLYTFDIQTKEFSKILGNIPGLTTLYSPNGKFILYGNASENDVSMYVYDIDKKAISSLGVKTLPEKCVWSQDNANIYCAVPKIIGQGNFPDSWYQGISSFSDSFWKIDMKTKAFKMISDPSSDAGTAIDATNLFLDKKENHLFLINKNDSTLWSLKLN